MRLIDADAYAIEMRKRQDACRKWKSEQNPGSEMYARAEQALVTFIEASLTLENQPTIDAIPVEWLEDMQRESLSENDRTMFGAIEAIFIEWHIYVNRLREMNRQKEQEAQK